MKWETRSDIKMKQRHLIAVNLINLLVIASYVECIQLDNELVSKPQRK